MAPIRIVELDERDSYPSTSVPPPIQRAGESKNQTIHRLAAELKVANMAKTHAERKLLEVKDIMSQRDQLIEASTQQAEAAWETIAELKKQLATQDVVIKRLKEDADQYPLSSSSLLRSHELLSTTIDTLRECLTCPLCYDGFGRGEAVSLRCGHTFCQNCIDSWAASSQSTSQPVPKTETQGLRVQCPECRTPGSSRIRLYMLEEAIRLLARAERERETVQVEELTRRAQLEVVENPTPTDYLDD